MRNTDRLLDALIAVILAAAGVFIYYHVPSPSSLSIDHAKQMAAAAQDVAWLLIFAAACLTCSVILMHGSSPPKPGGRGFWDWVLVAIPIALGCYLIADGVLVTKTMHCPAAGGIRYFWLDDDVMISMRYARNLARGAGLVWNAGEVPIEGFTNFLWTVVMSLPHLCGISSALSSVFILLLNALLLVLLLLAARRLGRLMGISRGSLWLALLLIAGNRWLIYWTVAGSEVTLFALLAVVVSNLFLKSRRKSPAGLIAGLTLGLIGLVRADALILIIAFLPAALFQFRTKRAKWTIFAPAIILPATLFIWRHSYYGNWMPNTYYLKARDFPMKYAMGIEYASLWFYSFGAAAILNLTSMRLHRHPTAQWLSLVPLACIGYAALIGGDELPEFRFIVPVVPLIILNMACALDRIFVRKDTRIGEGSAPPRIPGRYGWLVISLVIISFKSLCLPNAFCELGVARGRIEKQNVILGLALKENTEPNARIAHFWAGAAPYFSDRPAIDMLGKNDAYIAHLPGHYGEWPPGHVKYDPAYSLSLKPDVIVTALPVSQLDPKARAANPDRLVYPGLYALYEDPNFISNYQPGLVQLPISKDFHAIFVRSDSNLAKPPDKWHE